MIYRLYEDAPGTTIGGRSAAAGVTVGELIARLNESEGKWNHYHLSLLMFFYISAIAMAPYFIGTNKAKLDFEPTLSSLPIVKVVGDDSEKWRLVATVGDNYLLGTLSEVPSLREFRVVPVSSEITFSSTRKKE